MNVLLLLGLLVAAAPAQAAAPAAPSDFDGIYDPETDTLRLSWNPPPGNDQNPADSYNIYLNGAFLDDTAGLSYEIDLSQWQDAGARAYQVTAVNENGESGKTLPMMIARATGIPSDCPLATTTIDDHFQFVWVVTHEECFPI